MKLNLEKYPWETPEFRKFLQNEIDADVVGVMVKTAPPTLKKKLKRFQKQLIDENKAELKRLNAPTVR